MVEPRHVIAGQGVTPLNKPGTTLHMTTTYSTVWGVQGCAPGLSQPL